VNTPVMISVLCGHERDGWIVPGLLNSLLAALHDGQQQGRPVALDITCAIRPVSAARNAAVAKFLQSPCDWLIQIDNDQYPRFRVLDLIKAAEAEGKFIVAAPTPILKDLGAWNVADGPDTWCRKLPAGWFQPHLIGAGFLATHRAALGRLPEPFFDGPYEDFYFCKKAQDAGVKLWANSRFVCGHMHTVDLLSIMERNVTS
jgi:hypothetical protein